MHVTMTSGFHMLREIKLFLKISMISHMSGFNLLGEASPKSLSFPPPQKKKTKVFPEKKSKAISNTNFI